jgi:putative flippase GtrA
MTRSGHVRGDATPATRVSTMRFIATFLAVGAAGAGSYVVLSMLIHASGVEAWISSLVSYTALIPVVYLAQRRLTFQSKGSHLSSFPKYIATQLLGLALSGVLPYILVQKAGLPPLFVFAPVAIAIAFVNFVLLKFWTFSD